MIVPAVGAGTSASTLSVEISTTVSSSETLSPASLCHSSTVPSDTDSPIWGMTMSTVLPSAGAASAGASSPSSAGGAAPLVSISASTAPTATVSPSCAWILTRVPVAGAGTSASTLSVETSTRVSSALTVVSFGGVPLKDGAFGDRLAHLGQGH